VAEASAPWEAEVRFPVPDPEALVRRLRSYFGRGPAPFAFRDVVCRPRWGPPQLESRILRVRCDAHPGRCDLLLSAAATQDTGGVRVKRSRLPWGKVRLAQGSEEVLLQVADLLGFEPWFAVVHQEGCAWRRDQVGVVVERVSACWQDRACELGWTAEVEVAGGSPEEAATALASLLRELRVDPGATSSEPLPVVAARSLGLLPRAGAALQVYFCGAIRGGRRLQPRYARVVGWLQQRGHTVLTTHVARPDVLEYERSTRATDRAIYEGDMAWIAQADAVVAEVTVPSLGVGMEVMRAQDLGKPVLCLCEEGTDLSSLVTGNPSVQLARYRSEEEMLARLEAWLAGLAAGFRGQDVEPPAP